VVECSLTMYMALQVPCVSTYKYFRTVTKMIIFFLFEYPRRVPALLKDLFLWNPGSHLLFDPSTQFHAQIVLFDNLDRPPGNLILLSGLLLWEEGSIVKLAKQIIIFGFFGAFLISWLLRSQIGYLQMTMYKRWMTDQSTWFLFVYRSLA